MIEVNLGIDPGLKGAISVISSTNTLEIYDLPITPKPFGKGNMISPQLLSEIVGEIIEKYSVNIVALEAVSAMKAQGVTSVFSFGRSVGVLEGVVAAFGLPIIYVTPQKWKKHFDLIGREKDAARIKIIEMYPDHADLFKRKKDVDRADATFIGLYGGISTQL